MKKQVRSAQEQAVAVTRVAAATRLQQHRPKAHADKTKYDRKQQKRLWQNDQEALPRLGDSRDTRQRSERQLRACARFTILSP